MWAALSDWHASRLVQLSLMEECGRRVERALAAGPNREARHEMKLYAALGPSLMQTKGPMIAAAAWTRAFEIAESLDVAEYQLRSLWGLWLSHTDSGRHRVALAMAERFCSLAASRSDPNDRLIGERMIGASLHYLGDQSGARRHIDRVLAHYVPPVRKSHIIRFQNDQRVMARIYLARILSLQGFPDQAMRTAETSIEDARATNHAISLCNALSQAACPIALFMGDLAAAEHYVGMLLDHSATHSLARWSALGRKYQGVLAIKHGDLGSGLRLVRSGPDELGEATSSVLRLIAFLMAEALGCAGQIADGLAAAEEAIEQSEHTEERWLIAELLRVKGELLLLQGAPDAAAAAEGHLR
jgi:predicted ATPase